MATVDVNNNVNITGPQWRGEIFTTYSHDIHRLLTRLFTPRTGKWSGKRLEEMARTYEYMSKAANLGYIDARRSYYRTKESISAGDTREDKLTRKAYRIGWRAWVKDARQEARGAREESS